MFEFTQSPRIKRSPFHEAIVEEGVKSFYPYNNMFLPTGYGNPEEEYWRLINGVSMWDVACQRQIEIKGPDSEKLTQVLCPRDLSKFSEGQGKYIPICNHDGVIINDPVVLKHNNQKFWLSIADSNILFWSRAIANERKFDVQINEADASPLAVQGPNSEKVISSIFHIFNCGFDHFRHHFFIVNQSLSTIVFIFLQVTPKSFLHLKMIPSPLYSLHFVNFPQK